MNAFAENRIEIKAYRLLNKLYAKLQGWGFSGDVILFIAILAGLNSHLLGGSSTNLQFFFLLLWVPVSGGDCSAIPLFIWDSAEHLWQPAIWVGLLVE